MNRPILHPQFDAPIEFDAPDGYRLAGHCWTNIEPHAPVVVMSAATSVRCAYYARFAAYLHRHGFHVITYDYRGIGQSRHNHLRDLQAGWLAWGELDVQAALNYARTRFPQSNLNAVGHSIGGALIGLAPSNRDISRVFTMGAQHAYWPDYQDSSRRAMLLRWHVAMPLLTRLFGYFPGKRLGWLEDTPAGVVRDWTAPCPDFVDTYLPGQSHQASATLTAQACDDLRERFAQVTAATLAISVTDDQFGTVPAIERLLSYFTRSARSHLRLAPSDAGADVIGHFGFFHGRFENTLWPIALQWLQTGELSDEMAKRLIIPNQSDA